MFYFYYVYTFFVRHDVRATSPRTNENDGTERLGNTRHLCLLPSPGPTSDYDICRTFVTLVIDFDVFDSDPTSACRLGRQTCTLRPVRGVRVIAVSRVRYDLPDRVAAIPSVHDAETCPLAARGQATVQPNRL